MAAQIQNSLNMSNTKITWDKNPPPAIEEYTKYKYGGPTGPKGNPNPPIKLHLGCFQKKIHGWVNVDVRDDVNPDVVDDCATLSKFENNSASVIYCSHLAEHFKRKDHIAVFKRWLEVLKPGGILRLAVPDMEAVTKCYLYEGDIRPFQHMIFGSQRHDFDYHYIGFDEKFLRESLLEAGFKSAERYDWRGTEHFFVDDFSQAYWPSFDCTSRRKEGVIKGKLISLNMEAVK